MPLQSVRMAMLGPVARMSRWPQRGNHSGAHHLAPVRRGTEIAKANYIKHVGLQACTGPGRLLTCLHHGIHSQVCQRILWTLPGCPLLCPCCRSVPISVPLLVLSRRDTLPSVCGASSKKWCHILSCCIGAWMSAHSQVDREHHDINTSWMHGNFAMS